GTGGSEARVGGSSGERTGEPLGTRGSEAGVEGSSGDGILGTRGSEAEVGVSSGDRTRGTRSSETGVEGSSGDRTGETGGTGDGTLAGGARQGWLAVVKRPSGVQTRSPAWRMRKSILRPACWL